MSEAARSTIWPDWQATVSSGDHIAHAIIERVSTTFGSHSCASAAFHTVSAFSVPASAVRLTALPSNASQTLRYRRGDVMIVPRDQAVTLEWDRVVTVDLIAIDPDWLNARAQSGEHETAALRPEPRLRDSFACSLIRQASAVIERGAREDARYASSLISTLAEHLMRHRTNGVLHNDRVHISPHRLSQVLEYIEQNLSSKPSVAQLASIASLSESHFTRAFRAEMGVTPHQYVTQVRLDRAADLARTTSTTLHDIAIAVGFANGAHLARVMRARRGLAPSQLRR